MTDISKNDELKKYKDFEIYADPLYFGCGLWFSIHLQAFNCFTEFDKKYFIKYINLLTNNIACSDCRKHFAKYVDTHPLDNCTLMNDTHTIDKNSLFAWTVKCHNEVNKRTFKKKVSLADAHAAFKSLEKNVCENCGTHSNNNNKPNTKKKRTNRFSKNHTITQNITPITQNITPITQNITQNITPITESITPNITNYINFLPVSQKINPLITML
jgi:hypothetical protein